MKLVEPRDVGLSAGRLYDSAGGKPPLLSGLVVGLALCSHMRAASGEGFAPTARELFGRVHIRFTAEDRPPNAALLSAAVGLCRLTRLEASAHSVSADRVVERTYDVDSIKIILQVEGRTRFEQNSVSVAIKPKSWIVYDPVRPYELFNTTAVSQLLLQVPRHCFTPAVLSRLSRPHIFDGEWAGMPSIMAGLMRSTIEQADKLDEVARTRIGDTLVRLLPSLIEPPGHEPHSGQPAPLQTLRLRIHAYMEANLTRNSLDIDEIAERMGCSRRYIYRAFEADDTTPDRYLWDMRLERCCLQFAAPEHACRSISEIAFSSGFSSSAHFSRAFRQRFGRSPREYRSSQASRR